MRGEDGKQRYQALGSADDTIVADGVNIFAFGQAQDQARAFFDHKRRELAGQIEERTGPLTVGEIVKGYLADRRKRGSKGIRAPTRCRRMLGSSRRWAQSRPRSSRSPGSMRGSSIWPIRPAECGRSVLGITSDPRLRPCRC